MFIVKSLLVLRKKIKKYHQQQKTIAFIPTMGNLHKGHMELINVGSLQADIVVVSIFINPIQFDNKEDLKQYPRTIYEDCEQLKKHKVHIVFVPNESSIYRNKIDRQTIVDVPYHSSVLEGETRPGHFRGVATIICKFFNLIQPHIACFGEKDFQQLLLIRQLVSDMNYDIKIISVPTVRDNDGLALSSRNNHLTCEERQRARNIYKILKKIKTQLLLGNRRITNLLRTAEKQFLESGIQPDILAIRDAYTLKPIKFNSKKAVLLFSGWLGKTRLIDNMQVNLLEKKDHIL
ncbi:MAG: pantoate--beta-alanine ligase (plasmid) [Arsenophonus sp.]|nr:MAG: pantoate--beta-alanine ligase [Arsenophonus sp.]